MKKVAKRTLLPLRKRLQQKKRPDVAEICDWAEPGKINSRNFFSLNIYFPKNSVKLTNFILGDCNNNNNGDDQHDLNKDGNLNVGFANNNADAEFK